MSVDPIVEDMMLLRAIEGALRSMPRAPEGFHYGHASALREALTAAGLAIVPVEASPLILAAGWGAVNDGRRWPPRVGPGPALAEVWTAMLKAASAQPPKTFAGMPIVEDPTLPPGTFELRQQEGSDPTWELQFRSRGRRYDAPARPSAGRGIRR
jgi:hypothetical protein